MNTMNMMAALEYELTLLWIQLGTLQDRAAYLDELMGCARSDD